VTHSGVKPGTGPFLVLCKFDEHMVSSHRDTNADFCVCVSVCVCVGVSFIHDKK